MDKYIRYTTNIGVGAYVILIMDLHNRFHGPTCASLPQTVSLSGG